MVIYGTFNNPNYAKGEGFVFEDKDDAEEFKELLERFSDLDGILLNKYLKQEATANSLESEKQRRVYYETLVNVGIFDRSFIDENKARDIVRQGVKEEQE